MEMFKFNDRQLSNQLAKQEQFLRIIYPFLLEKRNSACVEIRPIQRTSAKTYLKSLQLWRFDDKGLEQHLSFLDKINAKPVCVYYSGFAFNYDKQVYRKDGKLYIKGKINNENALFTMILPMDFDGITEEEHETELEKFKKMGIETISIFTGHGFQDLILLANKCYDKQIYKKFTYLLKSKGFKVDEAIIDPARVLRLPHTFNCKAFDEKSKYHTSEPEAIPVKRIYTTYKRYNLDYVINSLENLENKDNVYWDLYKLEKHKSIRNINTNIEINVETDFKEDIYKTIDEEYKMLDFSTLPEPVKKMLVETPEHYRNSVLLFLIPFLRNTIGLGLNTILEVIRIWGKHCKPKLEEDFLNKEVKRIYDYNNHAATGKYTSDLASKFGYIDFDDYMKFKCDNKIKIPNDFIEQYNILSDGAVKIYLALKLYEKTNNKSKWTIDEIEQYLKISSKTFQRNVKDLLKTGFIDKKRNAKNQGEKYSYYINKYYNRSLGFTIINTSTIRMMIYDPLIKLNDSEIKVYTYINKMLNNNVLQTCCASQKFLSIQVGKNRTTLVNIIKSLVNKKYINKDIFIGNDGVNHCIYTIIY